MVSVWGTASILGSGLVEWLVDSTTGPGQIHRTISRAVAGARCVAGHGRFADLTSRDPLRGHRLGTRTSKRSQMLKQHALLDAVRRALKC